MAIVPAKIAKLYAKSFLSVNSPVGPGVQKDMRNNEQTAYSIAGMGGKLSKCVRKAQHTYSPSSGARAKVHDEEHSPIMMYIGT